MTDGKANPKSKTKPLRGKTLKRVIAIFLANRAPSLSPYEIYRRTNREEQYFAIYSAIRTLLREGIIGKAARRGLYFLKDRTKALHRIAQGREDFAFQDPLSTPPPAERGLGEWFRKFMDLEKTILERLRVEVRLDSYQVGKIRAALQVQGEVPKARDRSQRLAFADSNLSLVVSKGGWMQVWLKGKTWHLELLRFLRMTEMEEASIVDVFRQIAERLPSSDISVETPLKVNRHELPKTWEVETRVGNKTIVSRICSSHFNAELETSGFAPAVMGFLNSLAAVQHFEPLKILEFENSQKMSGYLAEIYRLMSDRDVHRGLWNLTSDIHHLSEAFERLTAGFVGEKPAEPEPVKPEAGKTPDESKKPKQNMTDVV